ncbi:ABC transporter substrate-binding protein [Hydrogenophaga sp. NH-16]|uniref:ABC transporter substrate-binding protein n=1 Tax=Hydrogenophaga sp. NH-16 TaxID=2184519 RepID=UPI000FDB1179|nr:ABC transporter substrate-binding protein [Hydrogenophaga sp. NH-16]
MTIPTRPTLTRRDWLQQACAGAAALASGTALAADEDTVRVAWISPQTGALAAFGVTDRYAVDLLSPRLNAGIPGPNGKLRKVQVELHDAASSSARAQALALARELIASGVHLVLATATPEICNPVSDVCEAAGVPCVTAIAPWQAWFYGRKGDPVKGFDWTFHFFCGLEDFSDVYSSLLAKADVGQQIGGIFGDDIDGDAFVKAFPGPMKTRGLELWVPDRVPLGNPNWAALAQKLKAANIQAVTGVLPPPAAMAFFSAAQQVGYKPRMASIAKAFPFPDTVAAVHREGLALTNEVWWSPAWPFTSKLTGQKASEVTRTYEVATGKPWLQTLGFSHALMEVVAETFRTASNLGRAAVRDAVARMQVNTVVGPLNWRNSHPNRNVCITPAVGGQWQRGPNGRWVLHVVDNTRSPFIPRTEELKVPQAV